jgi:hypothetical protein
MMKKRPKVKRKVRKKSPFEKYQGIGTPGIGSGRKAIQKWLREMRGELNEYHTKLITKGLRAAREGKFVSHTEMKRMIAKMGRSK